MTAFRVGIQLALTRSARLRTALLVLAAALAGLVLLTTVTAGRFEVAHADSYRAEMPRLVAVVVAAVALPCLVLLATVARLSASMRDRRLANLRLIGLTPGQTRAVATAETGVAAALGSLLGWLGFWTLRPVLVDHPLVGRRWDDTLGPAPVDQAVVLLAVPLVVVLVGLLPTRTAARDPLAVTRRADRTPPRWWRLAPLLAGAVLCALVVTWDDQGASQDSDREIGLFLAGTGLLALGLVLVLPVLVRLLTRALAGRRLGPAARIAVRRLEAQPAGVARIIGTLLIGLFLVTGARYVLVAFESTTQYRSAAHDIEAGQWAAVASTGATSAADVARLREVPDVRGVLDLPMLTVTDSGLEAVVATCADLGRAGLDVTDCRDGEVMWLDSWAPRYVEEELPPDATSGGLAWTVGNEEQHRVLLRTPVDAPVLGPAADGSLERFRPDAVIPPSLVPELPATTTHTLLVTAGPGRDLLDRLGALGFPLESYSDYAEFDFVASLRAVVWTLAAVVLGIGLLALAIATIDRGIQRRKEVVGLQLVGVGPGVLRRAQLLETGLPVTLGAGLAIGLGSLAGAAYLTLDDGLDGPWRQTWVLLAVALLGCLVVAGLAMIAATPRLRPEEIRAE